MRVCLYTTTGKGGGGCSRDALLGPAFTVGPLASGARAGAEGCSFEETNDLIRMSESWRTKSVRDSTERSESKRTK